MCAIVLKAVSFVVDLKGILHTSACRPNFRGTSKYLTLYGEMALQIL
jgi:hypothetical protein